MAKGKRRRRVLIVEDEPALRLSYERAFNPRYDLVFASTGAEALEQLEEHKPDVAVLDMRLPDTDGVDLLRRIRESQPELPVIITTVLDSPNRAWEPYDSRYTLPARLHQAGVRFAIAGSASAPYANRLPYEAGAAIAFGLPEEEALRAVTLYPARFLGLEDRVGTLAPGRDATLLITTGSPLEYATTIEQAYIQGRRIDMRDAHRQFYEKYRERLRQAPARRDPVAEAAAGTGQM
jgi:CheY-like chemotaxis protein